MIEKGRDLAELPAYWNAFGLVFARLLRGGRVREWPVYVNERSPAELDAVAARAWTAAVLAYDLPSDAPDAEREGTPPGLVVAALGAREEEWAAGRLRDLYREVSELGRAGRRRPLLLEGGSGPHRGSAGRAATHGLARGIRPARRTTPTPAPTTAPATCATGTTDTPSMGAMKSGSPTNIS